MPCHIIEGQFAGKAGKVIDILNGGITVQVGEIKVQVKSWAELEMIGV